MTNRTSYWIAAGAALIAVAVAALWTTTLNHDVAWYLYMIDVARHGGRLYRDVIDTNPPLIIYLMWPSAWLASLLPLGSTNTFRLYECSLALTTLTAAVRWLPRIWPNQTTTARGMVGLTVAFALFPFLRHDFGQREHFAVLLTLPYIWLAAMDRTASPKATWVRVAVGVAAGLGFSLKPHFIVAWLGIELYLLLAQRQERPWRRPELPAAIVVALAYVVFLVTQMTAYFDVARQALVVYSSQRASLTVLLSMPDLAIWAVATALLGLLRLAPATRRLVVVMFVATTGYLVAALLQRRGWTYHMYPARAFMSVYLVSFAIALFDTVPGLASAIRGGLSNVALGLSAILVALSVRYTTVERLPRNPDLVTPLVELIRRDAPRGPIASLSMRTVIYPAFPAINETGAEWSLRHNGLWFLPGLYEDELVMPQAESRYHSPGNMDAMEREWFQEIVDDLCAKPPQLLLVEPPVPGAPVGRRTLDLVAYYRQDPRFDRLFQAYASKGTLGTFTIYEPAVTPSCGVAR